MTLPPLKSSLRVNIQSIGDKVTIQFYRLRNLSSFGRQLLATDQK